MSFLSQFESVGQIRPYLLDANGMLHCMFNVNVYVYRPGDETQESGYIWPYSASDNSRNSALKYEDLSLRYRAHDK